MIDGYKFKDGKVIVVNYDKDNEVTETEREYQDNIEELLEAENVREHLYYLRKDYNNDIVKLEKVCKDCSENIVGFSFIGVMAVVTIGVPIAVIIGSLIPIVAVFIISLLVNGITISINARKWFKALNQIKGYKLALEGINELKQKNQRDLRRLRNDVKIEKEYVCSDYQQLKLDSLEQIDDYLDMMECIGANQRRFLLYIEKGLLEDVINQEVLDKKQIKVLKRVLRKK